jgi:hypothetical protein
VRIGAWTRELEADQRSLDGVSIPALIQDLGWSSNPHWPPVEPQSPEPKAAPDAAVNRWSLRDRLRPLQPCGQQRSCGLVPIGHVHVGPGWQHGLATCKSVHSCPVCSGRLRVARTAEVQRCIASWTESHGSVAMLTLTVRHAAIHDLRRLRSGLTESWSAMWKTREGRELRHRFAHYVRALDVTWGAVNGWHPHIHVLLFVEPGTELDEDWLASVQAAWAHSVQQHLGGEFRPREDDVGCKLTLDPPRAEYLLKLGLEVSSITTKSAKPGRHGPWEVARNAVDEQSSQATDRSWRRLWQVWALGMRGARHLSWSRYLRAWAELPEQEAEQLELELELVKDDRWILSLTSRDWAWTFGAYLQRGAWSYIRRPSVLLGRTRKSLPETLSYLQQVGLEPKSTTQIEISGRTYVLVTMRRTTMRRLQC